MASKAQDQNTLLDAATTLPDKNDVLSDTIALCEYREPCTECAKYKEMYKYLVASIAKQRDELAQFATRIVTQSTAITVKANQQTSEVAKMVQDDNLLWRGLSVQELEDIYVKGKAVLSPFPVGLPDLEVLVALRIPIMFKLIGHFDDRHVTDVKVDPTCIFNLASGHFALVKDDLKTDPIRMEEAINHNNLRMCELLNKNNSIISRETNEWIKWKESIDLSASNPLLEIDQTLLDEEKEAFCLQRTGYVTVQAYVIHRE